MDFNLNEYSYDQGIGIDVELSEGGIVIAKIRLLCTSLDGSFDELNQLSSTELFDKVRLAILDGRYDNLVKNSKIWQTEVVKLGYSHVSPLLGNLKLAL